MKKTLAFFSFILVCSIAQAQSNVDSLWGVWQDSSAPDSSRAQAIYTITRQQYLFSQPDSAFYYAQILFDFAREKGLKKEMANALSTQGISYYVRSDYTNAMEYYLRSLQLCEEISDKKGGAKILNNIGVIYSRQGDYPKALDYYQRSFQIKTELSDKKGMAGALNNIGLIYMNHGNYPKALDYYQRSLQIMEEVSDQRGVAQTLNNIGLIYMRQKKYPEALDGFQRSLAICEGISDKRGMAGILSNIGLIYVNSSDYTKALDCYQQCLQIMEEIDDKMGIASMYSNIGEVYMYKGEYAEAMNYYQQDLRIKKEISDKRGLAIAMTNIGRINNKQGNHSQAITWCLKGLSEAEEIQLIDGQKTACECLYEAYKALGVDRKALEYHERISLLDDSLQAEETTIKLQQMEFARQVLADSLEYEQEKIKRELDYTQSLHTKNKQRNIFIFSVLGIVILFISTLLFLRYKSRKDKIIAAQKISRLEEDKKLLSVRFLVEGQKEERKRIATELHDGLGVLLSVTKMQFSALKDENPKNKETIRKATQFLEQASGDVRKISHNLMPGLLTKLGLYEALEDLFEKLSETKGIEAECNIQGQKQRLTENTEYMVYRIIQEMVHNTLKHADAKHIGLNIDIRKEELVIRFSDDGKGFNLEEQEHHPSIGLQSIWSRVNFLDGTIINETEPGKGTHYTLHIPI
ncbi:tetratricopeptide repeat protein [Bacteroidota bacterium]